MQSAININIVIKILILVPKPQLELVSRNCGFFMAEIIWQQKMKTKMKKLWFRYLTKT